MQTYKITTGEWFNDNGLWLGKGYSGNGASKNNPSATSLHNHGPIPVGFYTIGTPTDEHPHLGPFAIPLYPDEENEMFGRLWFFVHGDSMEHPGDASNGCIIQNPLVRRAIADGGPRLQVIE